MTTINHWETPAQLPDPQRNAVVASLAETDPWTTGVSCVDGRGTYRSMVQIMGGSFGLIPMVRFSNWVDGNNIGYEEAFHLTFEALEKANFRIGYHDSRHGKIEIPNTAVVQGVTQDPDCGFVKNFGAIIGAVGEYPDQLKALINSGAEQNGIPHVIGANNQSSWDAIAGTSRDIIGASTNDRHSFLRAKELFDFALRSAGTAGLSTVVQDEHREKSAHVNFLDGYTLDYDALLDRDTQAFNLDAWYVERVLSSEAFQEIGVNVELCKLLLLGLYQATERVLRPNDTPLPLIVTTDVAQIEQAQVALAA